MWPILSGHEHEYGLIDDLPLLSGIQPLKKQEEQISLLVTLLMQHPSDGVRKDLSVFFKVNYLHYCVEKRYTWASPMSSTNAFYTLFSVRNLAVLDK